jgi:peptidoglycan/LPS O-acetylase OafA/YrhL
MLDLIRGLAALEVFLSHLRTLFFSNYHQNKSGILVSAFYYLTGFSHESVVIFFVLSGFFISRNIIFAQQNGTWSWKNYLTDRLVRLWIVLIPALLFTVILDRMGIHFFPYSDAYHGAINFIGHQKPAENLGITIFLGNLFFLQGIYVNTLGSNMPLWSLANEFWYYIIFPLFYFAALFEKWIFKIGYFTLGAVLLLFVGKSVGIYFLVWLVGYFVLLLPPWRPAKFNVKIGVTIFAVVFFIAALNLARFHKGAGFGKDLLLAITTGLLVYLLTGVNSMKGAVKKAVFYLSDMSYSLYLVHLPLAFLISSWFVGNPVEFSLKYFIYYLGAALMIFLVASLFWLLFESRYKRVRVYIKGKLTEGIES